MSGKLDHAPAQIIQQLLIDLGLATDIASAAAWPVYYSDHPNQPDDSICVYNTDARLQGRSQVEGETQEFYGIQVRVRSASVLNGYNKCQAIASAFDLQVLRTEVTMVTIPSASYLVQSVTRTSSVISLGVENPTSRRRLYTLNAMVSIRMTEEETGTGTD